MKIVRLAAILVLAACSSPRMDDPVFKEGYEAGCAMAHASPQAREAALGGRPALYRRGFASGYGTCGGGREFER